MMFMIKGRICKRKGEGKPRGASVAGAYGALGFKRGRSCFLIHPIFLILSLLWHFFWELDLSPYTPHAFFFFSFLAVCLLCDPNN